MLTDLHLQKYLQGMLSKKEEAELEAMMEKNPALKKRMEELQDNSPTATRPMWERMLLDRSARKGSKVRYTTILPALLMLLLVLGLTSHWFNKPGRNSTFLQVGGRGNSMELLYNSPLGWRFMDANYRISDSLTVAVRDSGAYTARVFAVFNGLPEPVVMPIWSSPPEIRFTLGGDKPSFALPKLPEQNPPPRYLALVYDTASLEQLAPEELLGALGSEENGRAPSFQYQVFQIPEIEATH